jgi:hypothetical protein
MQPIASAPQLHGVTVDEASAAHDPPDGAEPSTDIASVPPQPMVNPCMGAHWPSPRVSTFPASPPQLTAHADFVK